MLEQTGATAVMVARGSYGNPWIFSDAAPLVRGEDAPDHPLGQRLAAFRLHVRLMEALGTHMARARSLSSWYFKGIEGATSWRARAMECRTADEFVALADSIEGACDGS